MRRLEIRAFQSTARSADPPSREEARDMIKRFLAWFAVLFGAASFIDRLLVGQVNPASVILVLLGAYYFHKNGLLKARQT
jgi:hypothetical protein